jgi:hypothetical protein
MEEEKARFFESLIPSSVDEASIEPRLKRVRTTKKIQFFTHNEQGEQVPMTPLNSPWYSLYVVSPNIDVDKFHQNVVDKFHRKFRLRFRMPYGCFRDLLHIVKTKEDEDGVPYFRRWMSHDATGSPSSPIELMLLGSLRYLGRGWTFDDIEEATCINQETHRQFFDIFITFGRAVLFPMYVVMPKTAEDVKDHMLEMASAGFPGNGGSTDATHVMSERISNAQQQSNKSWKLGCTARTFNLTCNHRRKILSTTSGHPARWNDKTLQIFDPLMQGIDKGDILGDFLFTLLEADLNGNIVEVEYKGVWLMVDNGYLRKATAVPPLSRSLVAKEIRWSQWLESMRKDVECTFGILKGRWRILKAGIRLHGVEKVGNIWHTCCALHNMLLEVDGLDQPVDGVLASCWEGEWGELGESTVEERASQEAISAIHRLNNPTQELRYDWSGMGAGNDVQPIAVAPVSRNSHAALHARLQANATSSPRVVKDLPLDYFRDRLIEHFDIKWRQNKVVWPVRNKVPTPPYP